MKVGDFGLAEDVYTRGYFRQGKDDAVKLPFKWMAPESLRDGLFSEKSDVVSLALLDCMIRIPVYNIFISSLIVFVVVIWHYLLGGVQWWKDPLLRCGCYENA